MKIFTTSDDVGFAKSLCDHLGQSLSDLSVRHFSDGEINLQVNETVRGEDVYIVQSICSPVNDHLMRMLLAADAMRLASAKNITAVIPYFGYARQDRRVRSKRVPISARLVADLLQSAGYHRVVTVDLHSEQVQGFFHIPVENIHSSSLIIDEFSESLKMDNLLIVSPDVGGVGRAQAVAKRLNGLDLAVVDKRRSNANQVDSMQLVGDVAGKHCLIIDDMVDTGKTLVKAADLLINQGALSVSAYCTHAVLSGDAVNFIETSMLSFLYVSDSVAGSRGSKIKTLSLAPLLAKAIGRINCNQSLSEMYEC
jgi:ribose-phosphate pyrophosphokinase